MYESNADLANQLKELSDWEFDQVQGYSLGYLLRLMPKAVQLTKRAESNRRPDDKDWLIRINMGSRLHTRDYYNKFYIQADTPEDAACKLAIELFKQNILKSNPHR